MIRRLIIHVIVAVPPAVALGAEPTVNFIDYGAPAKHLAIPASLGNRPKIVEQATALKGRNDRTTLRNVLTWVEKTLKYDPNAAYQWRNYDEVMKAGCYGGCADHSIVCGALLRAAGIPTVWVKTMDVPWIWDFKQGRPFDSWSGHVFLEVYLDKRWVLLDPGAKLIYANYSPQMRILPGTASPTTRATTRTR